MSTTSVRAYHFVGATLRDGSPIPPDGVWLEHTGPITICQAGYHASRHPFDALQYAPGATLCLVEIDGDIVESEDKLVGRRRRIVARIDATDLLRRFACDCALTVAHLWDMPETWAAGAAARASQRAAFKAAVDAAVAEVIR
jgi:hypothetical protein